MYDIELKRELLEFKVGAYTIDDLKFKYEEIVKIIKNRTKEKKDFVDLMFKNNIISKEKFEDYKMMIENDYKICRLYVLGFLTEYEI